MVAITQCDPAYDDMNWDSKTVVTANGLLKMYTTFQLMVSFVTTMNVMAIIKPISIKLQRRSNDIVNAYQEVASVIDELSTVRGSEEMLHEWYMQAEAVGAEVQVVPVTPRTTARQAHRENVAYSSTEDYYRRALVLPLLDQLTQQMRERFGSTQIAASRLLQLIPSVLCTKGDYFGGTEPFALYYDDLPNSALVRTEVWRWKAKWQKEDISSRPSTLQHSLRECDKDYFPNLYTLLRIACTLPVTSCENE